MNSLSRSALSWLFVFCTTLAAAQTVDCTAVPDTTAVAVGAAFVLRLGAPPSATPPGEPDFETFFAGFDRENLLGAGEWTAAPTGGWQRSLQLITFDTGLLTLPPLRIPLPDGSDCRTPAVVCHVYAPPGPTDPADLADIRDIHRTPPSWLDYLPWLGLFGALLLILVTAFLLRRAFLRKKVRERAAPELPPSVWASRQLDALEKTAPWQRGDVAGYYTDLSRILRTFIERQTGVPALEAPPAEWAGRLPESVRPTVDVFLDTCDLAKFARHTPPPEAHPRALHTARALVRLLTPEKKEES
ncbi:MAG: hypothetical protein SFV52_02235 [Saprospiraceae bacterium]|nr:hypothetical protein [Saprospiraceae bacterium]